MVPLAHPRDRRCVLIQVRELQVLAGLSTAFTDAALKDHHCERPK